MLLRYSVQSLIYKCVILKINLEFRLVINNIYARENVHRNNDT